MLVKKEDWQKKGVGHRQRLKDKFQQRSIEAFSDAEVLELLLILGTPRKDCKEAAKAGSSKPSANDGVTSTLAPPIFIKDLRSVILLLIFL